MEKLLDSGSVVTSFSAPTVCEIDKMDSVGVDNGKGLSAALGVRA